MATGYIYIFTNPSFKEYVKIGFAKDVKQRLTELNRSTAVPFAFRVFATYEVDSDLSDKKLHSILDKLNPELRSVEEINGKKRVREFYAMTPEDAYNILEAIAEINGYCHRLKKWKASASEKNDEKLAQTISDEHKERLSPFTFSKCNITIGDKIEFYYANSDKNGTLFTVIDDKHVEHNGQSWTLTALAKYLTGITGSIAGPRYFKYKGNWLNDIRKE